MKKVKFTLVLALSMLFMGANIAQAQFMHNSAVTVTASIKGNPVFYDFGIFKQTIDTVSPGYPGVITTTLIPWGITDLQKDTVWTYPIDPLATSAWTWPYGSNSANLDYTEVNLGFNNWVVVPYNNTGNLYYYGRKSKAEIYNVIYIATRYIDGNEVMPVVKRITRLGNWTVSSNRSTLNLLDIAVPDVHLHALEDNRVFRPYMDRKTDIAEYVFYDDILGMLDEYGWRVLSIHYEISLNDEVGSDTSNTDPDQPPVYSGVGPSNRSVSLYAEDGITVPYIPPFVLSGHALEFKVTSAKEIDVDINLSDDLLDLEYIGNDTWSITIHDIRRPLTINITTKSNSEGTEGEDDGTTGNKAIATDAVWSSGGTLYVQAADQGTLSVYTVTGQLCNKTTVSGSYSLALPKGLYIVQLNGKAYKIVL